ncbi:MAG TPA: hypothetical protein QF703_00675 [Candidatus Thalassarchaeaceae archaeon]|nr:hypothetical protein [Candidatus Thalassarchaeaceae archaeon]|tara:strand:+ start:602 stop:1096 length:495 start_codon:yes stop_codon:yes gene_type:complete
MVNLFRLLGLPNPNSAERKRSSLGKLFVDPGPKPGNKFHDLGELRWAERTGRMTQRPSRRVIYIKPDELHRVPLEGLEQNLSLGDMAIIDLSQLNHMPSQQSVCARRVQDLGNASRLPIFALNEDDTLLMIAGAMMRVDTHKHRLGSEAPTPLINEGAINHDLN